MTHRFKFRRTLQALLVVCALCFSAAARADLLVTASGESMSGDLTRVKDGILVFRTSLEGQMMLPMSEVKSLTTDQAWVVTETGGTVHVGRFVPEGVEESGGEGVAPKVALLSMTSVDTARPVPGQPAGASAGEIGWSGEVGAGVRAFEGTRDGVEPQLRLGLKKRGERINTSLQLSFDADGEDTLPSYFRGSFDITEATEESWAPFVQALVERNTNEALQVRTGLTVGMRYRFDTQGGGALEGLAGIGASYGEWSREYLDGAQFLPPASDEDQSELNMTLGLRYSRSIWGGAEWSSGVYLKPSLTDADNFRAGATSSVVYPVTNRLHLRLEMLMNYDHKPEFSSLNGVDTSVGASIELDF